MRVPEIYMGLEAGLLVEIFWVSKLARKEGEPTEVGGEHIALPSRMQGPVSTQ